MSSLYLRLPSRATAEAATQGGGLLFKYAVVTSGNVQREGVAALSELSDTIGKVHRVVLLVAASDVSLFRLQVPPLSGARLKAALPNLVEEHLVTEPAECVIVAGAAAEGMRTFAVTQRAWLETIAKAVGAHRPRGLVAVPAQLCLPYSPGTVSASVEPSAEAIEVAVRLSEEEGVGVAMAPESSPVEVLGMLRAMAQHRKLTLYLSDALIDAYRVALASDQDLAQRMVLAPDEGAGALDGVERAGVDLIAGLGGRHMGESRRRPWRWPIVLAAGVVAINLMGLYADWWRMKSEADRLRAGMIQTFKSAFPKESVILDPVAQAKQKIAAAQRAGGQLAPDDFLVLLSRFGDAWVRVTQAESSGKAPAIVAVEYRDRTLLVRPKADGGMPEEALKEALETQGVSFSQPAPGVWQVRSIK